MSITIYSNEDAINWGVTGEERIVQNVLNIIRTRQFEVPFMREFGIDNKFIDAVPSEIKSEFAAHITEVINTYEPRVTVVNVNIEQCDSNGDYVIAVELEV